MQSLQNSDLFDCLQRWGAASIHRRVTFATLLFLGTLLYALGILSSAEGLLRWAVVPGSASRRPRKMKTAGATDLVSPAESPAAVLALATNEELIVARRAFAVLRSTVAAL